MRGELQLVNGIRSVLAPANPVPASDFGGDPRLEADIADRITALRSADLAAFDQPERRRDRERTRSHKTWRLVAPALSGLAVVAVVAGVTVAAGPGPAARRSGGGPAAGATALPRFYIAVNSPHDIAPPTVSVHDSRTGRTIDSVRILKSAGPFTVATAATSDREFFIVTDSARGNLVQGPVLYRLRLAENGRIASLTRLSVNLGVGQNTVNGIALSPDGTKLALAEQIAHGKFPQAALEVISLNHGSSRVWRPRPEQGAFALNPVWTSNKDLAFLWWDHLRGPFAVFTARTQERVLDTTAPSSNLFSARVLATANHKLAYFVSAFTAPNGGPIIASAAKNVPVFGPRGQATVYLVALSPVTGKVTKVFDTRVLRFHNDLTLSEDDYFFRVYGIDAAGSHALVDAPAFGRLSVSSGKFTKLPSGPGLLVAAVW